VTKCGKKGLMAVRFHGIILASSEADVIPGIFHPST